MLKIWKQTWRKDEDKSSTSYPAAISDDLDDFRLNGSEFGELRSEYTADSSLNVQHEGFDDSSSPDKAPKRGLSEDNSVRSYKKQKLHNNADNQPSTFVGSDTSSYRKNFELPNNIGTFLDSIFEQAKRENSVSY